MAYQNPYLGESNPYLEGQIDAAHSDVVRNYNLTTQPAYNSAMVKSGSFGNSGIQQMNENAQRNMQGSLGDISTQMRGQDYRDRQGMYRWDQEMNRNLFNDAFGQNQSNVQLGMGLLGQLNGYNQQDLQNANRIQNTPLDYWQQFSNSANAAGGMGGTQTANQGTSSSPLTAALGGAQLGSSAMNWWTDQNNRNNWSNNIGTSGNNYSGSSRDYSAPNYQNEMDRGYII